LRLNTEKEITWDMAANSDESFEPAKYEIDAPPPTAPDNNGNYPTPAKGRKTFFATRPQESHLD